MSVSYENAMITLQKMFPTAEPAVINMVLESNQGHMERTVEQMLAMNLPNADAADVARVDKLEKAAAVAAASGTVFDVSQPQRDPAMVLAEEGVMLGDEFLRPPSYFRLKAEARGPHSRVDEDAALAQLLQDQEFMAELHANPEAFGFRRRRRGEHPVPPAQRQAAGAGAGVGAGAGAGVGAAAAASAAAAAAAPSGGAGGRGSRANSGEGQGSGAPARQAGVPAQAAPADNSGAASGAAAADEEGAPAPSQSVKSRWNALGAAAKRKFAALAAKFSRNRGSDQSNYMSLPGMDESGAAANPDQGPPELKSDLRDFVIDDDDDDRGIELNLTDDDDDNDSDGDNIRLQRGKSSDK